MTDLSGTIQFKTNYAHVLEESASVMTPIKGVSARVGEFVELMPIGLLIVSPRYAWDGSTWAKDTQACYRASLFHDALYQLIREGRLEREFQLEADQLYRDLCICDGMWRVRAWTRYYALRAFGRKATEADSAREVRVAP